MFRSSCDQHAFFNLILFNVIINFNWFPISRRISSMSWGYKIKSVNQMVIFFLDMKGLIFWNYIAENGFKVNWNVTFWNKDSIFWNKDLRLRINYHADSHSPWFFWIFCFCANADKNYSKVTIDIKAIQ